MTSSALYMAGDINFENDERRSTGTSTASLTIKRLLSLKARLFVLAGAKRDTGVSRAYSTVVLVV